MRALTARAAFALSSALAVGAGAATLAMNGVPASTWVRNPLSWLVGALLAAFLPTLLARPRHFLVLIGLGLAALLATFAAAPVQGVHRWIDLGPLHINAAALALPAMLASLGRIGSKPAQFTIVAATGVLLVCQPDSSQASAFAAGSAILLLRQSGFWRDKLLAAALCAAVAVASWLRPDALEPVAEVEGILALVADVSPILAVFAGSALALACAAPILSTRSNGRNDGAVALAIYFAITAVAPVVGAFPVPLVGLGMSFPLGWWLGVAVANAGPLRRPADD